MAIAPAVDQGFSGVERRQVRGHLSDEIQDDLLDLL